MNRRNFFSTVAAAVLSPKITQAAGPSPSLGWVYLDFETTGIARFNQTLHGFVHLPSLDSPEARQMLHDLRDLYAGGGLTTFRR